MSKCKHKSHKLHDGLTRRQLLSMLGWAGAAYTLTDPVKLFTGSFVDGLISSAQAQSLGNVKNYVAILFARAPTRWVWDSFLTPNGSRDPFVANGGVKNFITEDNYSNNNSKTIYTTKRIDLGGGESIYLPPLWDSPIPTVGGGSVPMHSLLNNTMMIRGVNMQIDLGHALGPGRVTRPSTGSPSLTGVVADATADRAPIQALGLGAHIHLGTPKLQGYKSQKNSGMTLVRDYTNPLAAILSAFQNTNAGVTGGLARLAPIKSEIDKALQALWHHATSNRPGADVLYKNQKNADTLFRKNFGDLQAQYRTLFDKYKNLETRCAREAVTGILPANLTGGTFSTRLPEQFAVAEFMIKEGYSSSITMGGTNEATFGGMTVDHDEHIQPDRQAAIAVISFEFRVLAAMLYEFRRSLGPKWNDTVVQFGSEFDRYPKDDGTGSDHAANSNIATIMSGTIPKATFIGNIRTNPLPTDPVRKGTYGAAAGVATDFGDVVVTNEHVASTVASLLNTPSPVRAKSLIDTSNGGFKVLAEKPKNVG